MLLNFGNLLHDVIDSFVEVGDSFTQLLGVLFDVGVGLPLDRQALHHIVLSIETRLGYQFGEVWSDSALGVLESSETLLKADSDWEQVLDILCPEMDGERHLLAHDLELVKLLREVQELDVEVKVEGVSVNALLNVEDVLGLLLCRIDLSDIVLPLLKVMLLSGGQCVLEAVAHLLQSSALMEILPVGAEYILDSLHVEGKLPLDLLSPDDLV